MKRGDDRRRPTGCRLVVLALVGVAAAVWSGVAHAGVALQPASGSTTSAQPTFSVYLEPQEQPGAKVYVAADPQMGSYFIPTHLLGSCIPATPTGAQYTFSCQPSLYSTASVGSSLPPGTYYWWLTFYRVDPGGFLTTLHISGPLVFTVPAPTSPVNATLVSPADGATVGIEPTLSAHIPAGATVAFYASSSSERLADGSPAVAAAFSCSGPVPTEGDYTCQNTDAYALAPGSTYYWWAVITLNGTAWVYGPRTFTVQAPTSGGGGGGGSGVSGGNNGAHTIADAPQLPSSAHFSEKSIKQTRLSQASYALSKLIGLPKTIAVACWDAIDWQGISGNTSDSYYAIYGLYLPLMPHWINLSPDVCHGIETLLYHRPAYPNRIIASDVDTVTHEMVHAMGVVSEARTECYAMQLSIIMAFELRVPSAYGARLARLTLANYFLHPPRYIDTVRCREDGAWDLFPNRPSPPWHDLTGL